MKTGEIDGFWWPADEPEAKATGKLTFDELDRASLELLTSAEIGSRWTHYLQSDSGTPILGLDSHGTKVTLYKCLLISFTSVRDPSPVRLELMAPITFVGRHYESYEDMVFSRIRVQYPLAQEWMSTSGIDTRFNKQLDGKRIQQMLTYSPPEIAPFKTKWGNVEFQFNLSGLPLVSNAPSTHELAETLTFRLNLNSPLSIEETVWNILYPFEAFFSLAIGKPVYSNILYAVPPEGNEEEFHHTSDGFQTDIRISQRRIPNTSDSLYYPDVQFFYKDVETQLGSLMNKWFELTEDWPLFYSLYQNSAYSDFVQPEQEFLNLVQLAELYHRLSVEKKELSSDDYKIRVKRIDKIVACIPPEDRSWVRQSITHKRITLKNRLVEILRDQESLYGGILNQVVIERIANQTRDSRHFLTHHDENLQVATRRGQALIPLSKLWKEIVANCLMLHIGIESDDLATWRSGRTSINLYVQDVMTWR